MKRRFLRLIALSLMIIMVLCGCGKKDDAANQAEVDAASTKHVCGKFTYILLEDGTAEIVEYSAPKANRLRIPDELDGHVVSSIAGNPWYSVKKFIVSPENPYFAVIDGVLFSKADKRLIAFPKEASVHEYSIPEGIQIIGDSAFHFCDSLESIVIPGSVTSIGDFAFHSCSSLQSITIPDSVTSIGDYAFNSCESLQSITIPDGVTSIGDFAFTRCKSLQSVTISDSVTTIGANPFIFCENLTEIIVAPKHPCLEVKDGVLFHKSEAEMRLVTYPLTLSATEYSIPADVTSIGSDAFRNCDSLQSVTIPDSVIFIGDGAFYSCKSLQSINIPDSVALIGNSAFSECDSLQSVTIPDSVAFIGAWAFADCGSLQSVSIPDSVALIGDYAFARRCPSLTLSVIEDSYAETYARDNDIPFVFSDSNE